MQRLTSPSKIECSGACTGFRMGMVRRDDKTGEQFTVCGADTPLWRSIKGTEWPSSLQDYLEFKQAYGPARTQAHARAKRQEWHVGNGGKAHR